MTDTKKVIAKYLSEKNRKVALAGVKKRFAGKTKEEISKMMSELRAKAKNKHKTIK